MNRGFQTHPNENASTGNENMTSPNPSEGGKEPPLTHPKEEKNLP